MKNQKIAEIMVPKDPIFSAIALLLNFPFLAKLIDNDEIFTKLNYPGINLFQSLIKLLKIQQNLTIGAILEYYRERPDFLLLEKIAEMELLTSCENAKHGFLGIIQILENRHKEEIINTLLNEAKTSELSREKKLLLQKLITETKR
jgi:DNA primase